MQTTGKREGRIIVQLLFLLILLDCSSGGNHLQSALLLKATNHEALFDNLIRTFLSGKHGFSADPLELEDLKVSVPYQLIIVKGTIGLTGTNGQLRGLRTMKRNGNCLSVTLSPSSERVLCPFKVASLSISYTTALDIQPSQVATPSVSVLGTINEGRGICIMAVSKDKTLRVDGFMFDDKEKEIQVTVQGLDSFVKWSQPIIMKEFGEMFNEQLTTLVWTKVEDAINYSVLEQ